MKQKREGGEVEVADLVPRSFQVFGDCAGENASACTARIVKKRKMT